MQNKLLSKALLIKAARKSHPKYEPSRDEAEMAIMLIEGQISTRQYAMAMGFKNPGSTTQRLLAILGWAVKDGCVIVKFNKKV